MRLGRFLQGWKEWFGKSRVVEYSLNSACCSQPPIKYLEFVVDGLANDPKTQAPVSQKVYPTFAFLLFSNPSFLLVHHHRSLCGHAHFFDTMTKGFLPFRVGLAGARNHHQKRNEPDPCEYTCICLGHSFHLFVFKLARRAVFTRTLSTALRSTHLRL